MIAGYVTFKELKVITGFSDILLQKLIVEGMQLHEINPEGVGGCRKYLYNLDEVEAWLRVHIY